MVFLPMKRWLKCFISCIQEYTVIPENPIEKDQERQKTSGHALEILVTTSWRTLLTLY